MLDGVVGVRMERIDNSARAENVGSWENIACRENFGVEKIMARRENEWGGEKTYYLPSTREPSGELYHERTKGFSK